MKYKKALVTGGLGFIGKCLVRKLLLNDIEVNIFDNLSRGNEDFDKLNHSKLKIYKGDIREIDKLKKAIIDCDIVFHLAFINGTKNFYKKPSEVLDVAIKGTLNIINLVKENNIKNFIYASSSEIYQTPPYLPTDEKVRAIIPDVFNPRYSYSGGKLINELMVINYFRDLDINYIIFRPHNIFGENMGNEHVIPNIVEKITNSSNNFTDNTCSIQIEGDGSETRSFCYVEDAIEQLFFISQFGESNNIYNIGQQHELKIIDLIKIISKHLNVQIEVKSSPVKSGSTARRNPDLSKIKKLGFNIVNNFEYGIQKTSIWYKNNYINKK